MKYLVTLVSLTIICSGLNAFNFKDFAEAIVEDVITDTLNNGSVDQRETNSAQQLEEQRAQAEAKQRAEAEAKQKAEAEAKRKAEAEAKILDDAKNYLLGLPGIVPELKKKAKNQDTLSFKGFYIRMPIQDAVDLYNYYDFTGVDIASLDKTPRIITSSKRNLYIAGTGELETLYLPGWLVDKIWGVQSLSGEKFAELFIENYFSKSIGSAWSAFIDQQTEMDDDFNTIYVWENVKHGYRLKLHSVSKSLSLNAIAKESDISFD